MAIRITRVYTRTGDRGTTGLVGGRRVAKDSLRVESYGAVDELNSWVGAACAEAETSRLSDEQRRMVRQLLEEIQQRLFDLGAQLATPPRTSKPAPAKRARRDAPRILDRDITGLERTMDELQRGSEPLRSFLLPGGGRLTATLHLCRTVCRRAERRVVGLGRREAVDRLSSVYLNRLSDLLFVLARWTGRQLGEPERLWLNERRR
ncbi:MAG: cob(I)yrinic acid a,c-diamide adenosyltransferase [Nitrospirae bacterium]|nr:cob(I)yrinic acid a,c-diamide adenosyltransferase [Nitrospirota bacterium]